MEYRGFMWGVGVLFLITGVAAGEGCGKVETDPMGILTLPATLQANTTCEWTISPVSNSTVLYLAWNILSLSEGDYLAIYNSSVTTGLPLANFTGASENSVFRSGGYNQTVVFFSKYGINDTQPENFNVQYNTKSCQLTVKAESGMIHAPLFNRTGDHLTCTYILSLPDKPIPKNKMAMTFNMFDLVKGVLEIFDGNSTDQPLIAKYEDGEVDMADVISSGLSLTLNMVLPMSVAQEGFAAAFTSVSAECSGVMNISNPLNITSPGFPANYSNKLDCRWLLIAPERMTLKISPLNFTLGDNFDHVNVVDGKSKHSQLLQTFSQSSRPDQGAVWLTNGRYLWIQFVSDEGSSGPGFKFLITPIEYGGALYEEGLFTVQSRENSTFEGMDDIIYIMTVPDEQQVELLFNDTDRLIYPTTEIICYDDITNKSNIVGKFTSSTPFRPVYSNTNVLMVVIKGFVQNNTYTSREHLSGYFHGVPNNGTYVNSVGPSGSYQLVGDGTQLNSTVWLVHNHVGGQVALHIRKLQIAPYHQVTVHSGLAEESLVVARFYNSTNRIPEIYVPDARVTYRRIGQKNDTKGSLCEKLTHSKTLLISASFEINPVSSQNISASAGTFGSPNYPDNYPFNAQFAWNISISQNKSRRVGFKDFNLAMNHSVQIEGRTYRNYTYKNQSYIIQNRTDYGSFVGSNIPDDMISLDDELWVTFSSLYNEGSTVEVGKGFLAEYETIDCGGYVNVNKPTKDPMSLSTPGYPKPVTQNTTCVWILEAPLHADNTSVNVINYKYELKGYTNNSESTLEIRDGGSVSSFPVPLMLPEGVSDLTLARGNKLWVRYSYSSSKNSQPFAFQLSYELYECGDKDQCSNGVCMHKDWKCNGVDDCGDGSDEKDCTYTGKGKGGFAAWAIALAVILTFFATLALTFIVPAVYKRFKYPNYSELRDLMTPVPT